MTLVKQYLVAFLCLFFIISCGGGGSSSSSNNTSSNGIKGTVTDMSGTPLEGVKLYVGDQTTLSDENGEYSLDVNTGQQSLTAELSNYALNNRVVVVAAKEYSTQNIKLANIDTLQSFNTSNGADIKAKEAMISLPSGAYKLEDGSSYSGNVTVRASYNKVTTANGLEAFPGSFLGQASDGETKVLQSYGFIDVTLKSSSGANLNLNDGASAT